MSPKQSQRAKGRADQHFSEHACENGSFARAGGLFGAAPSPPGCIASSQSPESDQDYWRRITDRATD
jgi:hypothetical protein